MLRCILRITFLLIPLSVQAAPKVYPLKHVIGFDDPSISIKATIFDGWIKSNTIPGLSEEFVSEFKKSFGEAVVDNISPSSKNKILVASLHLIRASQYTVPKKITHSFEYHLPITLSIQFTNPATGEVLYSFTKTSYATAEVHDSDNSQSDRMLTDVTNRNYRNLLTSLINEAKNEFNPMLVEASVTKIWKKMIILDKGSKFGIAKDDTIEDSQGNALKVSYVTDNYAIATALGAIPAIGCKFSKYSNQDTAKAVKKPRVLTMQKGWEDEKLTAISSYFDSEISKESAFTLLPVNESFTTILASLAADTNAGTNEITNQRVMPDYMIKFSYSDPRVYDVVQNGKFGFRIYEQYILGELLDKQGRIIYSSIGHNHIEDKVVEGIVFDRDARLEILLKNATVQLAGSFSKSIRFASLTLPVIDTKEHIIDVQDSTKVLRQNQNVVFYKNIGKVDGVIGEVQVPIWEGIVLEATDGKARIDAFAPFSNDNQNEDINKDDVVIINTLTTDKSVESTSSVTYCSNSSSNIGTVNIDDFPVISHGFGYLLPYTLYDNDVSYRSKIQSAMKYGGFKQSSLKLGQIETNGRCLLPVYKVIIENREGTECIISLATGYRLYLGKDKKGAAASQVKLKLTDIQDSAIKETIQSEVSKSILNQLKDNIAKVLYQ